MLKNIWYCIKKTSEWYFALLVLYIILTLVNATIPILSAFLPKLVIEKLTLGSDIKGLIGTIMVFMGSIAVLTGVSKFLTKYLYFEKFSINVHYLKLVANKGLTTDYINQENGIFRKLQEESFLCCNGHSPLTQVYDVLQSLGTSVLGISVFSAVLYKLNVAVILFIAVTTAVSFYLNKRVVKWTDEHSKERMSYVQRLNYINAISGDARSAKDIRLYPMAKWFSDIYTDNMKGIAAWYHKLTKKLFSVTACDGALGLLREGIIYLYLIYLFMNSQISVADFVLYFGVVNGFSAWLSEIFAEVSVLNQLSTKINRFREYLDFPEEYLREGGLHGTRNEYRQVKKDDYLLVDGLHEALVSEEVWEQAQVKVAAQAKKYEKVNRDKREKIHLLSGILKCPVCGAGMYGNKSIKKRKDGSNYKDFYYYGCKHRNMTRGHKCDYKKQVHEEMLDASVAEVISKLVSNPKFSDLIRNKINMEVDTSALDQEIENYKIQLRKLYHNKDTILSDMDSLDYEDKHYQRRKTDLENHLYKTYDKIDDAEELLVSAKAKKRSLLADKITGDNIYKALVFFDKLYAQMNEAEKREFLLQLVDNVQIYEERKENGQWLKSIEFKLPIIEKEFTLSLDNDTQNETVVLLSHKKPDGHINVKVEFGEGEGKVPLDNIAKRAEEYKPKERVTYKMIKEYIEAKYGFKVHTAYIAEVKRDLGLPMYDAPNAVEELKQPRKHPTAKKVEAIKDALKHFEII